MKRKEEEWRRCLSTDDYEVSSLGRVRRRTGGQGARAGRVKKPWTNGDGYLSVQTGRVCVLVHRLVAEAFLPEPVVEINHKNGDKTDNRPSNIEWVTSSQNLWHAYCTRQRRPRNGDRNGRATISEAVAREILSLRRKASQRDVAKKFGVSLQIVQRIHQRITWRVLDEGNE